jgi:hypothetical protein
MNPRKSAADLSPSTFNDRKRHGKMQWTALFADSVQACLNPKLSDRSKVVWLLLQPMLGAGSGYLLDDGEPMSVAALATKIWREPKQVNTDIDNLVKFDLLRRDDGGAVFDPVMVNDLEGVARRNLEKNGGGQIETYLNEYGSLSKNANPKVSQYSTE